MGGAQNELQGALAVFDFNSFPLIGKTHETIQDIASQFPNFAFFNGHDVGERGKALRHAISPKIRFSGVKSTCRRVQDDRAAGRDRGENV